MYYNFKCESCNKVQEVEIPISKYDKEKGKQVCPICKGKMNRMQRQKQKLNRKV